MPQKARGYPVPLSVVRTVRTPRDFLLSRPSPHKRYSNEFEKNMIIDKRDFGAIEFLLRKGRRQLETYASPGVKDVK